MCLNISENEQPHVQREGKWRLYRFIGETDNFVLFILD